MWFRSDDPEKDFDRYDREQIKRLEKCPVCAICDDHITDDKAFFIGGDWFHQDCLEKEALKSLF